MGVLSQEILGSLPDAQHLVRVGWRLTMALLAGALIGYERQRTGKAAGLRTHMLVSMGAALFVVCASESGMHEDALSRVIQGIVTGIGFLGTGSILKRSEPREIYGMTTAAGIWLTAAVGIAIGLGQIAVGIFGAVLAWIVLAVLHRYEPRPKPDTRLDD